MDEPLKERLQRVLRERQRMWEDAIAGPYGDEAAKAKWRAKAAECYWLAFFIELEAHRGGEEKPCGR